MSTLRYKENTAGAAKSCQQPTCISLEDINNVRNSKEPCKSKMAQISEEMGSLSHPSPEFCYDKHTRSQKNDRMVSQYLALCNLTAYFFCGWLYSTRCHRHYPSTSLKHTEKERPYGWGWSQSTGGVQWPAGPATGENTTDWNVTLLRKQSPS